MIRFITENTKLLEAIREVSKELPALSELEGEYTLVPCEKGLKIENNTVYYGDTRSLLRAVGLLATGVTAIEEQPKYEILGAMPDASRNAVQKVETHKKLMRILALEGYNAVMLYTEDTYEVPEQPHFGHLRGRYTAAELRELDDYAALLGLEFIPAIQTLAHLNGWFEWPASYHLNDCDDIMLVGDERVYEFIDTLLKTMSENVRSRKINIGLDEAHMLGRGQYIEQNGYLPKPEIMRKHMERVVELCRKYGYTPRMWDDMFFRMINNGVYRVPGTEVPAEIAESVPEELTLVYWDYSQPDKENYDEMFRQHHPFKNTIGFAGGDSSWYGLVPLNQFGERCSLSATASLEEAKCDEVYVTMWGDDGASCSLFTTLHTLFIYGESCWGHRAECPDHAKNRLKALLNVDADTLLMLEDIHNLPSRVGKGDRKCNPSKYMFYSNILTGKFDCHIAPGCGEYLADFAQRLNDRKETCGAFAYAIDPIVKLAEVLALKAEMGHRLYAAYRAGDKSTIETITETEIPQLLEKIKAFRAALRNQWMTENKAFGFDVIAMRIGGLISQTESNQQTLRDWLAGNIPAVEELEAPRLPYMPIPENGDPYLQLNRWIRIAGQNIANMFGYK
ncbi:MAG: beta-N-acetylhexosaminidase [Clostridia bacterium]|nr:beta-N-acetylhexosaminidase [Clostridia bacterium]